MKISDWSKRLVELWETYWFSPVSLQRLAFCRLLAFGLLFLDMVYLQTELFGSKTDPSLWHPILVLRVLHRVFGFGPPPPSVVETIAFLTVILAIGAFVGYRTQVCALTGTLLYIYLIAVKYSSFARVHHTRGVFVLLLLALALSPFGEALSV